MNNTPARGALNGIRVLDLTSVLMGPLATQTLGDLGADVICIEDAKGDTNRTMGPGPHPQLSGVSLNLLRNKRNICLDLKAPGAVDAALAIAATCDVMITNLRPAPLSRLGLTYDDVRRVRRDIVFCQAHGWPSDSAEGNRPAYDDIVQTATGIADAFALIDGEPRMAPTVMADKVCGLTITYSVLAALLHRERTGEGQFIEVPMVDAVSAFVLSEHGAGAIPVPPLTKAGYTRVLTRNRRPHRTTDGFVACLPYSNAHYRILFAEGGRPELLDDPRASSPRARVDNGDWVYGHVGEILSTRSTAYWMAFCTKHDIPATEVATLDELVEALPIAQHPTAGAYRRIQPPARLRQTPMTVRREAPFIGEHNEEILREAGLDEASIAALRASGAVLDPGH